MFLSEKTEAVCVTPHTSLHSGTSLRDVVTQMVLCTGSSSCAQDGARCVCAAAGLAVTGSNPISLPELSAAGVDSKNFASPDSSCCCLVLKHK